MCYVDTREISVSEVRELPVGDARKMSGRPGLLQSLTGVDRDTVWRDSGGEKQAIKAEVLECMSLVRGVGAGLLWVGVAHIRRGIRNAGQRRFRVGLSFMHMSMTSNGQLAPYMTMLIYAIIA